MGSLIRSELINYSRTQNLNGLTRGVGAPTAAASRRRSHRFAELCSSAHRLLPATRSASSRAARRGNDGESRPWDDGCRRDGVYAKARALLAAFRHKRLLQDLDSSVNNWGAEQTAQQVSATSSRFIVVRFARTRTKRSWRAGRQQSALHPGLERRTWTIPAGGGRFRPHQPTLLARFKSPTNTPRTSPGSSIKTVPDPQFATWNAPR